MLSLPDEEGGALCQGLFGGGVEWDTIKGEAQQAPFRSALV